MSSFQRICIVPEESGFFQASNNNSNSAAPELKAARPSRGSGCCAACLQPYKKKGRFLFPFNRLTMKIISQSFFSAVVAYLLVQSVAAGPLDSRQDVITCDVENALPVISAASHVFHPQLTPREESQDAFSKASSVLLEFYPTVQ
ncbi:hypothetical protein C8J56DRAFT_885708 [Mycena floridula]|nr:hypothetical protein C8J56DRAFT_885708 [Mycena floridula]